MRIGFIGLGNMGAPITANLVRAGHDVVVWNRSAAKARPLQEAGAALAENPKGAASGADVVFTIPMPLLSLLRDHLLQAIAQVGEDVDCSAMPPLLALTSVADSSSSHVSSLGVDGLRAVA